MDYFIDESGNSGDLAKRDSVFSFGEQPFFSLAAIGVEDVHSLETVIEKLKARHRIKLPELKASALYDRPQFICELVENLCARRWPYFVEVVDKKFFLAAHITSRQLLPPVEGVAEDAMFNWVRNVVADYLYERGPDDVYIKFIAVCERPTDETLRAQLDSLIEFAGPLVNAEEPTKGRMRHWPSIRMQSIAVKRKHIVPSSLFRMTVYAESRFGFSRTYRRSPTSTQESIFTNTGIYRPLV
jgi:hypothetical protein